MFKPLNGFIVVSVEKEEGITKGGIVLATEGKPKNFGKVIAVANGIEDIKEGDKIMFSKYSPLEIDVEGEPISLIEYSDVFAIVK